LAEPGDINNTNVLVAGKGPLDRTMVEMVGEKVIPLQECDIEEGSVTGDCKTM
jgi:hypothetical protein